MSTGCSTLVSTYAEPEFDHSSTEQQMVILEIKHSSSSRSSVHKRRILSRFRISSRRLDCGKGPRLGNIPVDSTCDIAHSHCLTQSMSLSIKHTLCTLSSKSCVKYHPVSWSRRRTRFHTINIGLQAPKCSYLKPYSSMPRVAVLYQALEPPIVNGLQKPKKPGGASCSTQSAKSRQLNDCRLPRLRRGHSLGAQKSMQSIDSHARVDS